MVHITQFKTGDIVNITNINSMYNGFCKITLIDKTYSNIFFMHLEKNISFRLNTKDGYFYNCEIINHLKEFI
jgi:hypothetical protein